MVKAPERILVVEDSATQAAFMRMLLQDAGYQVSVAVNGREGCDKARAEQPTLVVTDLYMPEMNGLQLVETLKREYPRLPVVLTTAEGSEEIAVEALNKGAVSYVPKRRTGEMLIETVQQILALAHADRAAQRLLEFQTSAEVAFSVTNEDELVPAIVARLRDQVQQMRICDEIQLMTISTALDEALVNAMIHGNLEVSSNLRVIDNGKPYREQIRQRRQQPPYRDRRVDVQLSLTREEARFRIRDQGPGFDPSKIPDPRDPANLEKVSGRGLLLIHTFMDEVHHNAQGNEITMIKRRAATV